VRGRVVDLGRGVRLLVELRGLVVGVRSRGINGGFETDVGGGRWRRKVNWRGMETRYGGRGWWIALLSGYTAIASAIAIELELRIMLKAAVTVAVTHSGSFRDTVRVRGGI
jgi:hypothetical protein